MKRWTTAASLGLAAAVALGGVVTTAAGAAEAPGTQAEIERALQVASPGGRVVVAAGTIDVKGLVVPAGVTLAGQDVNGDGRSDTTLRLPAYSTPNGPVDRDSWGKTFVVRLAGAGAGVEMLIVNGNKMEQHQLRRDPDEAADTEDRDPSYRPYPGVRAPLEVFCDRCSVTSTVVAHALFDGIEVRGNNARITRTTVHTTGGTGIYLDSTVAGQPVTGTVIADDVDVNRTGQWFATAGWTAPGPGPGVGGALLADTVVDDLITTLTNGDGVALYASPASRNTTVRHSTFNSARGHCVHLGGANAVIFDNTCNRPGNHGFFIQNNQRDTPVRTTGGRIIDNTVTSPRHIGVVVRGAAADTAVNGNTVTGGTYTALFTNISAGALAVGGNTFTAGVNAAGEATRCLVATAAVTSSSIRYSSANPNTFNTGSSADRFCVDERQAIPGG